MNTVTTARFLSRRPIPQSLRGALRGRPTPTPTTPTSAPPSTTTRTPPTTHQFTTTHTPRTPKKPSNSPEKDHTLLEKPDKFRPPSHPARRVLQRTSRGGIVRNSTPDEPINYPGPKLSPREAEEKRFKKYPHMFPAEGTVMYKFLTSRWIHVWIAMGVLTSLATYTFTTNFKLTSPYAHLLPPWSGLLTHPIDTISQAISIYKMHVQHTSMVAREKRMRRVEDAEKRRQFRVAHGLEEDSQSAGDGDGDGDRKSEAARDVVGGDDQAPVALDSAQSRQGQGSGEYVDWEGRRRPVKKWLGIW